MYIPCWNCGSDIWIETQTECRHCGEPAKRCTDCVNYVASGSRCRALEVNIGPEEASEPTALSQSYRCPDYHQSPEASQAALTHKGGPRVKQPAAPKPAAQPKPAPKPASAPAAKPAVKPAAKPAVKPAAKPAAAAAKTGLPPQKRPHVIAHRGCCEQAPENTVAAIEHAVAVPCDAIEVDVHITSDGKPVVIHDATLERTTNGEGAVAATTFAQVRTLDAGSWFSEEFAGQRVPSLEEALAACGKAFMGIHVRCHENDSDRAERAIVSELRNADAVGRSWITHHTRHGLYRFRKLEQGLRLCWLPRDGGRDLEYIDDAFYMGYRIIQPTFRVVTPEFVEYAHKKQVWINVFWADDEALMRQLTALSVNGILTNKPSLLRQVVKSG
jgi:glycerophosphoryl diester phosphodiesterase